MKLSLAITALTTLMAPSSNHAANPKRSLRGLAAAEPGATCRSNSDCASNYCTGALLGQEGICVQQAEVDNKRISPGPWASRLNEIHFAGCHNCYQLQNAQGHSTYRSVVRSIPALELDVRLCGSTWTVAHGSAFSDGCNGGEDPRFHTLVEDYFEDIRRTLVDDKYQFPIIVNLDFKNAGLDGRDGDGESMNALILEKFGDRVFTKNDLAAYNGLDTSTDFANPEWSDFRDLARDRSDFWPKASDPILRNKVVFVANHIIPSELDDIREFNTFFLAPQFIANGQVSGEIASYTADGQTIFGNLSQDAGKCHGDLPRLLSSAHIISRCWDGDNPDTLFIEKQWENSVAIGTAHDVEGEPLEWKVTTSPDINFCRVIDSCNPGTFQSKRWTCIDNHNIRTGDHCPTQWVECKVGANPGVFQGKHWVCPSDHDLQAGNSCVDSKWVEFGEWQDRCALSFSIY